MGLTFISGCMKTSYLTDVTLYFFQLMMGYSCCLSSKHHNGVFVLGPHWWVPSLRVSIEGTQRFIQTRLIYFIFSIIWVCFICVQYMLEYIVCSGVERVIANIISSLVKALQLHYLSRLPSAIMKYHSVRVFWTVLVIAECTVWTGQVCSGKMLALISQLWTSFDEYHVVGCTGV